MFLTLDRQSVVEMAVGVEHLEERRPSCDSLLAFLEGLHIADQNDAVSRSGDEDIQPLRGRHEANVS